MRAILTLALLLGLVAVPAAAGSSPPRIIDANTGKGLFAANCSRCHGSLGQGLPNMGPSLKDAGALAADFYLSTGYMPLGDPHDQPSRSRVLFTTQELHALVSYVASLGHGPPVPSPQWQSASVPAGQKLFVDHCAGCHQIVARGGVVTGARVPPLTNATPRQIAEAVRVGPYLMPHFSTTAVTPAQLNDLIAYVQYTKHPDNAGGWSIGDLGPWPEGMVAWLLAGSILVALCCVFGRRSRT
ncbi:MAG TPA: c-type cytochrome [Gaiellaceae bacterium]|jgi:ubiquinol-cytochrome c reductase cytochrome c subunit|nr:c-type cytochrome [Gaiellaceae bacterium]